MRKIPPMSNKIHFYQIALLLLIFSMPILAQEKESKEKKPNIIFILTDDQGYGDMAVHGHPYLETPNMDRLHSESVRFDRFYVSPSCSPTRAALLTGMHEFKSGVTHTIQPREKLHKDAVTLADLLKTAGYKTGFVGKWHLGNDKGYAPQYRGFDWYAKNAKGPHNHFDVEMIRNGKRRKMKGFREDSFFDEAMTFITESKDQPFFLYLCTYSPHTPLGAPADLLEKYKAKGLNENHAAYLAMIENIDDNLGRLDQFLKKEKMYEDTIVIFMNDNGVTVGLDVYNAGMRGPKCTIWEGGTRAFSFWRWPAKWKPQTVNNLTAHLDVLPTLCEFAEVEIPTELKPELEGYDLRPLLNGKKWDHDKRLLFHNVGRWPSGTAAAHKFAMCGVRKGNFLLVHSQGCEDKVCKKYPSQCTTLRNVKKGFQHATYTTKNAQFHWGVSKGWQLFDVKNDPANKNDLSSQYPELVTEMKKTYSKWWDDQFDAMIERNGDSGDPEANRRKKK